MRVITAPEDTSINDDDKFVVYLAGAIDMGAAEDWQAEVIERLKDTDVTLLNPRRTFKPETLSEQILWELGAMDRADVVLMWFPSQSQAPIALLETGLYMQSGKLLIGAGKDYYRRANLEWTCKWYNVILCTVVHTDKRNKF
jgi:hypothetical protein